MRTSQKPIMVYEGYPLYEDGKLWASAVGDRWCRFKTAGEWKRYIEKLRDNETRKSVRGITGR